MENRLIGLKDFLSVEDTDTVRVGLAMLLQIVPDLGCNDEEFKFLNLCYYRAPILNRNWSGLLELIFDERADTKHKIYLFISRVQSSRYAPKYE